MTRLSFLWRTTLVLLVLVSSITVSWAQAPQGMNYQAVARDADGNPIADSSLSVTINLSQLRR